MSKILQIIPAPDGLYAQEKVYQDYGIKKYKETIDGEERIVIEDDLRWEGECNFIDIVCLALVETDDGTTEIHPMAVDEGNYSPTAEPELIDLTEYERYAGLIYATGNSEPDFITIVQQDGTGFVTMPKDKMLIRVQHKLDPDEKVPVRISCMIDGRDIALGLYSDDDAADFAYHKLVDNMGRDNKVYMPDPQEIDTELAKRKRHEEYLNARHKDSDINTTFTEKTAEVLIKTAKCYTLDDIEALTKDELMNRISKGARRRRPETCEYVVTELQEKGYLSDNT